MGRHSGYDVLCATLTEHEGIRGRSVFRDRRTQAWPIRQAARWGVRHVGGTPLYDGTSLAAEMRALISVLTHRVSILHVLYAEENYALFARLHRLLRVPVIASVHQPPSWWIRRDIDMHPLKHLAALVVMSRSQQEFFQERLPKSKVHCILHGVDSTFFCPPEAGAEQRNASPRFVFCGNWLRDTELMAGIVEHVVARFPVVQFDCIVPAGKRVDALQRIASCPQVHWIDGVSDVELRDIYRNALALVMPLIDCGANNAVLEAMACGLPIIGTAIGGLPDYTKPEFSRLYPVGDLDGFVDCIAEWAANPAVPIRMGQLARRHVELNLCWPEIARQTIELYHSVHH